VDMIKTQLLSKFKDMLPLALGDPYIVNTTNKPYIFVAFYNSKYHEMVDGSILNGCEFRIWKTSSGIKNTKALAGIIGISMPNGTPKLTALRNELTSAKELEPYRQMLVEMLAIIESGDL